MPARNSSSAPCWRPVGLHGLRDAIERYARNIAARAAELRQVALVASGPLGFAAEGNGVEARLLLVAEQLIESVERRTYGLHRLAAWPRAASASPASRPVGVAGSSAGQASLQDLHRAGGRSLELVEGSALLVVGLNGLGDLLDREVDERVRLLGRAHAGA